MASRKVELEVGKDKDIDSEKWTGKVTQKRMIYGELIKKISEAQGALKSDSLEGAVMMFDLVSQSYPTVNLKYGEHKFSDIQDLYDSQEGQAFINGPLMGALIKPVSLAKN